MAGPQSSFVPPRPSPSRPIRRFTLEQANRSLPLVKRVVADIVAMHKAYTALQAKAEKLSGKEQAEAQSSADTSLDRLQQLVDELTDIGCEIKDYQMGLIDFVSRHEGRDIYLCWKLGEENITHWHELHAGFAGRQPVSMLASNKA
jgi:hypothetical protein